MHAQSLRAVSVTVALPDDVALTDLLPRLQPSGTWVRHGEGIIGLGVADRAAAHGSERFAELAHWWERRLESITEDPRPEQLRDVPGCGPTAFTSVTYSSDSAADSVLVLPELVLGSVAGRTWVTVIGEQSEGDLTVEAVLDRHGLGIEDGVLAPAKDAADTAPETAPETALQEGTHPVSHYLQAVEAGVQAIAERRLEKLVLGRDVVVTADAPLSAGSVLAALTREYSDCWIYRAGEVLGATPEMLVTVRGERMAARVLAGTVDGSLPTDEASVLLMEDPKQRTEHEIAVQSLLTQLAPVVEVISAQNPPTVLRLPNVYHLSTDVTGRLVKDCTDSGRVGAEPVAPRVPPALLVAERAHPTAAICGTPTATAAEFIARLEDLDRGPFTGPVGWVDGQGNADFGVALRGGILSADRRHMRLYAGCGIVAGSEPESELAETWAKLRPMLGALRAQPVG
ncbi:isochorismate synthase [Nesterenkonia xinjiangensis]|uniref:Menaquinone-specific isochorismate synthase n=1 Tax=Nesterenkonia xinjiangensis TaxID=225327 RepID=A0A7Z0GL73_9MICC|nr:chorismate-binding protein [Nesterenkonia xinjiangensis]NYJ77484.1 menaquinone-specific isochorismate synthase [Nesterenkonia xinjiangensis]